MRTHIMLVLTAFILTACASKRDIASTNNFQSEQAQETSQQASFQDAQASRIR